MIGRTSNIVLELVGSLIGNNTTLQLDLHDWFNDRPFGSMAFAYSDIQVSIVKRKKDEAEIYLSKPGATKYQRLHIINIGIDTCDHIASLLSLLKNKSIATQEQEDQKELELFKPIAQQYHSLVVKPGLQEEARKYLVQATTATEENLYEEAIGLLEEAIAIDPLYPQAHFNVALLWAQVSIYEAAILAMKKYLMLVPDATDARAAQDKIYEWERKKIK
ncbi:MAG TPA: hypothetical protein VMZ03_12125 [Chitinophagaceae bacterium]|nr:hypothetical protein [Chitinophagaceae bacterium]